MIGLTVLQFLVLMAVTLALSVPVARVITKVVRLGMSSEDPVHRTFAERLVAKAVGPQITRQQNWREYAFSLIVFNVVGAALLFLVLRYQGQLPWNPNGYGDLTPDLAFNIMVSFLTDTGWQAYGGEATLSFFSQMVGLTSQVFLSCATGLSVAYVISRAFLRHESHTIGNFYADAARSVIYILLPMAFVFALFLIWQGVPQNMVPFVEAVTMEGQQQLIAQGPAASQISIKIIGGNGGGFFNANAAHPYENPTLLSNFMQMVAILLIPIPLALSFAQMVKNRKFGWYLISGMSLLFFALLALSVGFETMDHPQLKALDIDQNVTSINPGGNMEGKETRFGIFGSVIWSIASTSTTQGSMNSVLENYMPLTSIIPLLNILIGEVIYGGVGYGRYGFLIYGIVTVFIASLKIGRTPEYLGKKIDAHEIKLTGFVMLLVPIVTLCASMMCLLIPAGAVSVTAEGPHGLTQAVYNYASVAGNNGSAFGGFNANTFFQNLVLGFIILFARFGVIVPTIAIAGSLAAKKISRPTAGSIPTQSFTFVFLLIAVILLFGGLVYFPVLVLGPIAEHFYMFSR